jgi:hypothetical protein
VIVSYKDQATSVVLSCSSTFHSTHEGLYTLHSYTLHSTDQAQKLLGAIEYTLATFEHFQVKSSSQSFCAKVKSCRACLSASGMIQGSTSNDASSRQEKQVTSERKATIVWMFLLVHKATIVPVLNKSINKSAFELC